MSAAGIWFVLRRRIRRELTVGVPARVPYDRTEAVYREWVPRTDFGGWGIGPVTDAAAVAVEAGAPDRECGAAPAGDSSVATYALRKRDEDEDRRNGPRQNQGIAECQ